MERLRRFFLKLYLLFANAKVEAELAREIGAHLALLEDEYVRQGMTPEEARRAAKLAYGGVEQAKQRHRDERTFQGLSQIPQDIRYTFRQLRKSPGFTVTAVLMLARTFTQQEDEEGQQVAVLSYGMWQSRFHGDANVLGGKILLYRKPYTVIGVMPRDFEFPLNPGHVNQGEFWLPLSLQPEEFTAGSVASWNSHMVGRLKPGITAGQAQSDAERVAQDTMRDYPAYMRSLRIHAVVTPLHADTVRQARPLLRTLLLAVIVVLLIACANLAGVLLVRAIRRRREIAVRLALGARAATLLRQAIVESMVLSIAGGAIGLALAAVALRVGVSLLPQTLPRVHEIGLNWPVMRFALGLALLTGFLGGLAPAFAAIRTSVNETLKEGGRTGNPGSGHARLRSALVVAEKIGRAHV